MGRGFYTLLVENDVFTGSDQHYTNGLRLTYLSHEDDVAPYIRRFAAAMPFVADGARLRMGYAIGHNIYSPNNTRAVALVPNERPYAGYLYAGMRWWPKATTALAAFSIPGNWTWGWSAPGRWAKKCRTISTA
jgi:hypothetical protein